MEQLENLDHLMTVEELANVLQWSPKTLYAKVKTGSVPVTRLSGSLRFNPSRIAAWLRAHES